MKLIELPNNSNKRCKSRRGSKLGGEKGSEIVGEHKNKYDQITLHKNEIA